MEIYSEEFQLGDLRIQLSVQQGQGCRVIFTARDEENRRIWITPITDRDGSVKVYSCAEEAVQDAKRRVGAENILYLH